MENNFYNLYQNFQSHLDTGMSADIQVSLFNLLYNLRRFKNGYCNSLKMFSAN